MQHDTNWRDAFDSVNLPQSAAAGDFLARLLADAGSHARFMNTLALLEHMGSRRILLTQTGDDLDTEVLAHLAEEARHAWFFRRQAERLAAGLPAEPDAGRLAPAAARMYFRRLEALATRGLRRGGRLAYLYTSLLIELRAVWFYRLYQQALATAAMPWSLSGLLQEEDRHLADMLQQLAAADPARDARLAAMIRTESVLYRRLFGALAAALAPPPQLAAAG